jgi:DNA-binding transcriptional regulator YiaG
MTIVTDETRSLEGDRHAELERELANAIAEREGLARRLTLREAELSEAVSLLQGARAELAAARCEARTAIATAESTAERAAHYSTELIAARKDLLAARAELEEAHKARLDAETEFKRAKRAFADAEAHAAARERSARLDAETHERKALALQRELAQAMIVVRSNGERATIAEKAVAERDTEIDYLRHELGWCSCAQGAPCVGATGADEPIVPILKCPECSSFNVRTEWREQTISHGAFQVADAKLPFRVCRACDAEFTDSAAETAKHEALCWHLGVMTPAEVRTMRRSLNVSVAEFSHVVGLPSARVAEIEQGLAFADAREDALFRELAATQLSVELP